VHCTNIWAEFKFVGHSPLGAHPQKCGIWLGRWEDQRRLSSLENKLKVETIVKLI